MPSISSSIEVIENPGETCADCGEALARHQLESIADGVKTRAVLCKNCLDSRFGRDVLATDTCAYCGSPDGTCYEDPLLKMAGLDVQSRFACSRCHLVRMRFQVEVMRTWQENGGLMEGFMPALPNLMDEVERRTREYLRDHPRKVNPRVFMIPSMRAMAELMTQPHGPCATCGVAIASYRVWRVMEEQETEVHLCEQCLPERSPFMTMDFVPEDASCCFCGAPASFPVQNPGRTLTSQGVEEYECLRCSRLSSRYVSETITSERRREMRGEGLEILYQEAHQKVRDHLRDHPEQD